MDMSSSWTFVLFSVGCVALIAVGEQAGTFPAGQGKDEA